ncbi:unnamed protein product [Pocillopora meandrina]|uniref:CTHRC1 C-terminal domain-containing protein n=1 Tax=Pocillopora meandrina TaxID=46732 RepID=A0AAU9VYM5_9CNID|nr:unnamed protein product [Pocillopora meandrina]
MPIHQGCLKHIPPCCSHGQPSHHGLHKLLHEMVFNLAIDAIVYQGIDLNIVRPANIEGYCTGIAKGLVRVGLHVGRCHDFHADYDALTGWISVTRLIIEEIEPPVA